MSERSKRLVADAVARETTILVGLVGARGDPALAQELGHVGAGGAEQRTEPAAAPGAHAGKALDAGAPGQAKEDGLRLIVGGVPEGDEVGARFGGGAAQEL